MTATSGTPAARPDIAAIQARADAATRGPWRWEVNRKSKSMHLIGSPKYGGEFVLGFVRWGMQSAQALFRRAVTGPDGRTWHRMEPADAFAVPVPGREHHADWYRDLDQPDAQFIAHARADVPALLAYVAALETAITQACALIETGDQRLLAQDGPVAGAAPALSLDEWRTLYVTLMAALGRPT